MGVRVVWEEIRELVARPPRPLRAVVSERVAGELVRQVTVWHDGDQGWLIQRGDTVEVSFSRTSWMAHSSTELRVVQGSAVASGIWAKSLVRGSLMGLDEAHGELIAHTDVGDRRCAVVEARGLRADEPTALFRLVVDLADGLIMRLERPDLDAVLSIDRIEIAEPVA